MDCPGFCKIRIKLMTKDFFSATIIDWYETNHRQLPWRETSDPYKIWLSEVILQQTRIAQGLPYYQRFLAAFPTIFDLARAPEQSVLRLWQGLGYYSRARNLHRCAKWVVEKFQGQFPTQFEGLLQLPGVGHYTAAAIASIAFREPVAVVDGNVFRVLARLFGIDKDIASTGGKNFFFAKANELIDHRRPDLFNQALMEFGALRCLPRNPGCGDCPFATMCVANQRNLQHILPVKTRKLKVKKRYFSYFIIRDGAKVLMKQRHDKDIWRGLFDFYLIETPRRENAKTLLAKTRFLSNAQIKRESKNYTHLLTHQKLNVKFVMLEVSLTKKMKTSFVKMGLKSYSAAAVERLPKPILLDRYIKHESHDGEFW